MDSLFDLIDPPKKSTDWDWSFADYPKQKNGLKVFSCFACGGGSTMGYKLAGCDVLGCVEIDPKMNEIYQRNHNPKYNYCMDIRDFNKIPSEELPQELYDLDILDGSPPCTSFSIAGVREEGWGKTKKFREGQKEQTLDDLSFVFIETVKKLKPKVVIMENVEGLFYGEAFQYVQEIYRQFNEAGYFIHHWLLKGEQMGVPQTRHRVFFVATRADLQIDPSWLDMSFNYEPVTYSMIKAGKTGPLVKNGVYYTVALEANEQDKSIADTRRRLGWPGGSFQAAYIRPNDIVPTLRSNPTVIDLAELGIISPETIINAQTFPQDFDFGTRTRTGVAYVCGMSVPPLMMKRVVCRLLEQGVFDYAKSL